MKLTELISAITTLPWPETHDHDDAPDFTHKPNWDYARHAANVLPELVDAMQSLLMLWEGHSSKDCDEPQCAICFANKALARAENVETTP